jgi:hypothetical protein
VRFCVAWSSSFDETIKQEMLVKYLFNARYIAASSTEVKDKSGGRAILKQLMEICRMEGGEVVALQDSCLHGYQGLCPRRLSHFAYHGLY